MKIAIGIIILILIIMDLIIYIRLKKYCKVHGNELMEKHAKYIYSRAIWIVVLSVLVGILGIVLQLL